MEDCSRGEGSLIEVCSKGEGSPMKACSEGEGSLMGGLPYRGGATDGCFTLKGRGSLMEACSTGGVTDGCCYSTGDGSLMEAWSKGAVIERRLVLEGRRGDGDSLRGLL